jgi:hypothetical protein
MHLSAKPACWSHCRSPGQAARFESPADAGVPEYALRIRIRALTQFPRVFSIYHLRHLFLRASFYPGRSVSDSSDRIQAPQLRDPVRFATI